MTDETTPAHGHDADQNRHRPLGDRVVEFLLALPAAVLLRMGPL